ncbi:DUF6670 family protein [Acinetobacter haemolyticus]|uniref:DUF6670 family protein n=1 Tax=Acinetobacter haemolyticus TaxID=29430 RepID=UPI003AF4EDD4
MKLESNNSFYVNDYRKENLINTNNSKGGISGIAKTTSVKLIRELIGVININEKNPPMPDPVLFYPYAASKKYGITHFGIMIPDLPAPHYFLACATMLGGSGFKIYDIDHAVSKDGPRHTAVLAHATAVSTQDGFKSYSMLDEMIIKEDGSLIKFGEDLEFSGLYPHYRLKSQRENFSVDLQLEATGDITWFCKSKIYNHLSLMTRYKGIITTHSESTEVSGLCTYEYARGASPYLLRNKSFPESAKVPFDTFSYQVIDLDENTQLLLVLLGFMQSPFLVSAYLRTAEKDGTHRLNADVHFEVLSLQDQSAVAPDGSLTPMLKDFRWTITAKEQKLNFIINGTVDTPMVFGLGRGFIGGYRWEGSISGVDTKGRGYIEYVDQRE